MAKKAAGAPDLSKLTDEELRANKKKKCPKCGAICGFPTRACPDCAYEFRPKGMGNSPARKAKGGDVERKAMEFVLFEQGGSIEKSIKAVETYQADTLAAFIGECGGAANALSILQAMAKRRDG